MRRFFIIASICTTLVVILCSLAGATRPAIPQYFNYTLEPKSLPDKSGPVELVLTFKMKPGNVCDSVLVQVGADPELAYDGPARFWASLAETGEYSTTLSVTVPPNDTSEIAIRLMCQGCAQDFSRVFITTGDATKVLDYIPTPCGPEPVRRRADSYLVRSGESHIDLAGC